jgi:ribosome biogenesis protein Tsr3
MIQPTQYFQLENVPLFNGAYIILSVEHNITANKMTTSFSGTKLLKYPIPRVLNPVAFTGLNANLSSGEILISALNIIETKNEAHYTAMYNNTDNSLKID